MIGKLFSVILVFSFLTFLIVSCTEDDETEFIDFYNPDSGCDTSNFVYDYYGKGTRVTEGEHKLYIDDEDCTIENSNVDGLYLYINNTRTAVVRCGYTTDEQCRFFWVHPEDGRHMIITGTCTGGYSFIFSDVHYDPCHN